MAGDRASTGDPKADVQEASGALDSPGPLVAQNSLAYKLAPLVDRLRELKTRVGIRPYRVFLVHAHWSGDRRGNGELVVTSRREVKPTPRIRDMAALSQYIKPTGRVEDGDIFIDEISATIPEADLMGQTKDMQDPGQPRTSRPVTEFFWEVEEVRPSCPEPLVRRFVPKSAPSLKRDTFQWTISLSKTSYDPGRTNDPERNRETRG